MRKHLKRAFIILIILSCLISLIIIIGAVMLYRFSKDKVNDELLDSIRSDGNIYFFRYDRDENGDIINSPIEINSILANNQPGDGYVTFDRIPETLKNAFIAIEDKRFYSHSGIDYVRSSFAVINYITKGKRCFGGSTITQQLVKNLTGDDKISVRRKISEAFAAIDLERRYDKTEILEAYLNIINLSHGCRGVGDAARFYYSKNVSELTLCEATTIAAITNNPAKYDPISHPDENIRRRNLILKCMFDLGFISSVEFDNATKQDLNLSVSETHKNNTSNSWYIDTVIDDVIHDLAKKHNISYKNASVIFFKGGYNIYTAVDQEVQNSIESFFEDISNFPYDATGTPPQSSMIVIDPHSGDILGVVGAIGKKEGNRLLNYATASKRPAGSVIKPLSVYAPALERGVIDWSTIFEDSPIKSGSGNNAPWPSNANNKYVGKVTVEYALRYSLNTVAVKVLHQIGNKQSFDFLKNKLMISSLDKAKDLGDASLALGQQSVGVTLRELVAAYSIFTDGIIKKTRAYYKVTDINGRVILDNQPEENRVISEESAAIMTKLLQNVVSIGTASSIINLNYPTEIAGKTGTTQFTFDRYFVGYTPTILAGVWQGFDMPSSLEFIGFNYSAAVWNEIIDDIYSYSPRFARQTNFVVPANVQKITYTKLPQETNKDAFTKNDTEEGWFDIRKMRN